MKSLLRLVLKRLHVWVGLSFGLLFCLMGLTGSVIVFRYQIEDALRPKWQASGKVPTIPVVDAALANVSRQWPDAEVTRIAFPVDAGQPYRFQVSAGEKQMHVFCDGKTGEVLGTFDLPWLNNLVDLHHSLLKVPSGKQLVGVIGIGLFLVSLSGLTIWLMRRPNWNEIGQVDWKRPWKRVNFDLHRSTGLIMNALLLLVSFTGMWMAYPNTFLAAVEAMTGGAAVKALKLKVKSGEMGKPIDAYVRAALAPLPGGVPRELRLPQGEKSPVTLTVWRAGDFRPGGNNQVTLDPASARVLAVDEAAKWSWQKRLVQGAKPVHYAEWGGLPLRLLWFALGLTPSMLFVSGLLIWSAKWLPVRTRERKNAVRDSTLVGV